MSNIRATVLISALVSAECLLFYFQDNVKIFYISSLAICIITYVCIQMALIRRYKMFIIIFVSILSLTMINHYSANDAHAQDFPIYIKVLSVFLFSAAIIIISYFPIAMQHIARKLRNPSNRNL